MAKKHSKNFVALVDDALTRVPEISPKKVAEKLESDEEFVLIDVREKDEFDRDHIPNARHFSKGVIERDIEEAVPDNKKEIVLYCGGGYRSVLAADNLQKMGYKNVLSMSGGWRGWKELE